VLSLLSISHMRLKSYRGGIDTREEILNDMIKHVTVSLQLNCNYVEMRGNTC